MTEIEKFYWFEVNFDNKTFLSKEGTCKSKIVGFERIPDYRWFHEELSTPWLAKDSLYLVTLDRRTETINDIRQMLEFCVMALKY